MLSIRSLHRPLMLIAALMVILGLVSAAGLIFDDRVLVGAPIWLKPLKFSISLAIYAVTFAWLISLIKSPRASRIARWLGTIIATAATIEQIVIVGQVVRGRTSHFNFATALDGVLFSIMGVTIVVLWLTTAAMGVLLLRQRLTDRASTLAVRLGLGIALAGLGVGFLMTNPTAEQRAAMSEAPPTVIGAHAVGVPDGGPGIPLVGWSTEGGDYRVGHFIGMHALQALPLLALALILLSRRIGRLRDDDLRARLVITVAGVYAAVTALVTWQATRGQSLIHPDGLTLGAAAVVLALAVAGLVWTFAARRRSTVAVAA